MKLDKSDQLLLDLLVRDARMSFRKLSERVGLSPSTCLNRVKRLEALGVIVGYRAVVASAGVNGHLEGWAGIRLIGATAATIEQFLRLIGTTPEIVEAHRISGDYDYAIRFRASGLDVWNTFRRDLAALDCECESRLSVLVEPLK